MCDGQRQFEFPGTAAARIGDPDGSYVAADKMNADNGRLLNSQQDSVLRCLKANNGTTAKKLGRIMAQADIDRLNYPHKRMRELELMGFVRRFQEGKSLEMVCYITSDGEKYLE